MKCIKSVGGCMYKRYSDGLGMIEFLYGKIRIKCSFIIKNRDVSDESLLVNVYGPICMHVISAWMLSCPVTWYRTNFVCKFIKKK